MGQPISSINFSHCTGIGDSGLKLLADAFATMPRLGSLELVNIGMTDEGCNYLCQNLKSQKQIGDLPFKNLDLRNNNIKESSVQALMSLKVVHPDLSYAYGWTPEFNFGLLNMIDH